MGIVRDHVLTNAFGSGQVLQAYYTAFKFPDLIYNLLIIGALTTAFIPVWSALWHKQDDKKEAWQAVSNSLNTVGLFLLVASILGILGSNFLAGLIGYGYDSATQNLTASFMRIMFLSPVLMGLSMVMGGVLQTLRQFVLYSVAPLLYNLGIILGAIALVPLFGPQGLSMGVVLGAALHFLLQWYGVRQAGFRWEPIVRPTAVYLKTIGRLMIPRTLGVAMTQFNTIIITSLASSLVAGSVVFFNLGNNLAGVPVGLIGAPFALAVFPLLIKNAHDKNTQEFGALLSATMRQILFLILPLTVIFVLLRAQIVRSVLGSGAFDWTATIGTADALAYLSLSLPAQALIPLLARGFYALENTFTPLLLSIVSETVTVICALLALHGWFGVPLMSVSGLAVATSIGAYLNMLLLYGALYKTTKSFKPKEIILPLIKLLVATAAMAAVVQVIKGPLAQIVDQTRWWGIFAQGLIAGLAGLAVYGALAYFLGIEEWLLLLKSFHRRMFRATVVNPTIDEGTQG
jgi:putative peptidoglycan lipid II flippase